MFRITFISFVSMWVFASLGKHNLPAAELVVNGDFEADVEDFITWPGYISNGENPPEITDWIGSAGGLGINPINDPDETRQLDPFNNGDNDSHFLLMQGAAMIEQEVFGLEVGREYVLTLEYNARNCCGDFPFVEMMLGDELVDDFPDPDEFDDGVVMPSGGPWWEFELPFTAEDESILLSVRSEPFSGGDATFIMDNVSIMPVSAGPTPQAGDADLDRDFDQLDLVQVQVAAKYLSGAAATWGEGDWDGVPTADTTFDNPPVGDGFFNQRDVIAALGTGTYLTGPYAAVSGGGQANDAQTSIGYDAGTGEVWIDAPAGIELTSVNIDSAGNIFTAEAAQNLGGSFDNDADNNVFKATFGGSFGSLSLGNIAQSGLSEEFLMGDLTVVGSLAGGGDLGAVDLIYVPEPAALVFVICGLMGWSMMRWRKT